MNRRYWTEFYDSNDFQWVCPLNLLCYNHWKHRSIVFKFCDHHLNYWNISALGIQFRIDEHNSDTTEQQNNCIFKTKTQIALKKCYFKFTPIFIYFLFNNIILKKVYTIRVYKFVLYQKNKNMELFFILMNF